MFKVASLNGNGTNQTLLSMNNLVEGNIHGGIINNTTGTKQNVIFLVGTAEFPFNVESNSTTTVSKINVPSSTTVQVNAPTGVNVSVSYIETASDAGSALTTVQELVNEANTSATNAGISETNANNSAINANLSAESANESETNAGNSEIMASKWAENPEDEEVLTGQYSAYHWARKSQAVASGDVIDDGVVSDLLTWSSEKIDEKTTPATVQEALDGENNTKLITPYTLNRVIDLGTNGAYGLKWNQETDEYEVLGATNRTQIQRNMKRCVLNDDGTVNYYLDPFISTLKEDGTPAVLTGADGNVMVQIPKFWYKHELNGNEHEWWVSDKPLDGFVVHPWFLEGGVESEFRYYRAYTCINQGGVLRSVSGVTPTRSQTRNTFRTQARANGAGWELCSWNAVNAIQILYLTEYCDFNTQAKIGTGNHLGDNYGMITGQSNVIGNVSSGIAVADTWMSYRGIENWYADCWEFVDGINVQNHKVFLNQNPATFADDVFTGDYVDSGVTVPPASNNFIKKISGNFIPTAVGGSSSTFVTDTCWTANGNMVVIFGGNANNGLSDGGFAFNSSHSAGILNANLSAGLSR